MSCDPPQVFSDPDHQADLLLLRQVKTRMQLQVGKPVAGAEHYNGMVDCFKKIIAKEGYASMLTRRFYFTESKSLTVRQIRSPVPGTRPSPHA